MSLKKNFKDKLFQKYDLYSKKKRKRKSVDGLLDYLMTTKIIAEKDSLRYMVVNAFNREMGKGSKKGKAYKLIASEFNIGENRVRNIIKTHSLGYTEKGY